MSYKCPHNLFWKGLRLIPENFKITNKALEIGNCCCLINDPWSAEEIREVWGLTMEKIMRCEEGRYELTLLENQFVGRVKEYKEYCEKNGMIAEQQGSILEGINREKIRWMKKTSQGKEAYTGKSAFKTPPANNPNPPF
jgi:hypothetical protein